MNNLELFNNFINQVNECADKTPFKWLTTFPKNLTDSTYGINGVENLVIHKCNKGIIAKHNDNIIDLYLSDKKANENSFYYELNINNLYITFITDNDKISYISFGKYNDGEFVLSLSSSINDKENDNENNKYNSCKNLFDFYLYLHTLNCSDNIIMAFELTIQLFKNIHNDILETYNQMEKLDLISPIEYLSDKLIPDFPNYNEWSMTILLNDMWNDMLAKMYDDMDEFNRIYYID